MAHLGELIAELRQDKGLTQKELGDILCVSSGTISNYENGVHLPDVDKVIALANYFHVTTDYLLGRTSSNLPVELLQQAITNEKTLGDVMASFAKLPAKVVKEPLVVTICSVFGVVLDAASYLPAGKSLNRYSCAGLYSHYTQASGSSKVYNRTYRYVYYEGYEEVDGYLRAQIDSSSKTVEFDKGQSYYYDYPLQVQDAYQSYKIMG